jgi:hypothetical protein
VGTGDLPEGVPAKIRTAGDDKWVSSGVETKPVSSKFRRDTRAGPCGACSTGKGGFWRSRLPASELIESALPGVYFCFVEQVC